MAPGSERSRGFTLLELMVVVALLALVVAMATLALRDGTASRLEEEAARLSALFEGARARARVSGQPVRWWPSAPDRPGFRFEGLPESAGLPAAWLDEETRAEVIDADAVRLGPEPVIGAQRVRLRLRERELVIATDGLHPFAVPADGGG